MTERVVKVTVSAVVSSYLAGMSQVAKASREGRTEAEALTAKLEAQRKAFNLAGGGMLAAGGLMAAGLLLATKRAADFDQAMSNVAATGEDARGSISGLREAAIDAGAETVYSAREAAGAIEELAKAGIQARDILGGGLTGALNLAAAGGIEVSQAAEIASNTLNQFKLEGKDAAHIADVLAAGAGKASGGVGDLGMALAQVGQIANSTGLSVEETTAGLAAFASAGLKGSDAGTSFKTMLGALTPNSQKAADEMKRLKINAFDAQGNFIGLEKFAGQLQNRLKGLTVEQRQASLEIMFGSDAVRAGIELYNQGAGGIRKWIAAVDDQGYAAETAATKLDNLNGDLEKLSGAFDSALISVGSAGQGPLRALVQGVTEVVDSFNDMPEGGQVAVYWVGAAATAATLAGGAFLVAIPKVAAYKLAVAELGPVAQRGAAAVGLLGKAGLWGAVAAGAYLGVNALADFVRETQGVEKTADSLIDSNASLAESFNRLSGVADGAMTEITDWSAVLDDLKRVGNPFDNFGLAFSGTGQQALALAGALSELDSQLANTAMSNLPMAQAQFRAWAEETGASKDQLLAVLNKMPEFKAALEAQAEASGSAGTEQYLLNLAMRGAVPEVRTASTAYQEQAEKVDGVREALQSLIDQVNSQNSVQQAAVQANATWVASLASLTAEVEKNGTSLDQSTVAGSANASMLAGLATDAQAAARAQLEVDQTTMSAEDAAQKYVATLAEQRKKFEESAKAAGFNGDEVKSLADRLFALPTSKEVQVIVDAARASQEMDGFIRAYDGRRIRVTVDAQGGSVYQAAGSSVKFNHAGGIVQFMANGGLTPMRNIATVVRPNTFRVVGDRSDVDESFIPLDGSARSHAILRETIRRMPGFGMADGGFVQPRYASANGSGYGSRQVVNNITVNAPPGMDEDALARKVLRKIENDLR